MVDPWSDLCAVADRGRAILCESLIADWPSDIRAHLQSSGLLSPQPAATALACPDCPDRPYHDVAWFDFTEPTPWLMCPVFGPTPIDASLLTKWSVCRAVLHEQLRAAIRLGGVLAEVVPDRLWKLGMWEAGVRVTVFLGRQLQRPDTEDVLAVARRAAHPFLLAYRDFAIEGIPVATLTDVGWWDRGLHTGQEALVSLLSQTPVKKTVKPTRRGQRLAAIESLTRALSDHLRAAREHAQSAIDHGREPQLLPRPTQRQLAKECRLSDAAVSRSLQDPDARELRLLWELATDLNHILNPRTFTSAAN